MIRAITSTDQRPTPMHKSTPLFCRFFPKVNNLFVSDQEPAIGKSKYFRVEGEAPFSKMFLTEEVLLQAIGK